MLWFKGVLKLKIRHPEELRGACLLFVMLVLVMDSQTRRAAKSGPMLLPRSSDCLTSGKEYLCYGVKSTLHPRRNVVEIESRIHSRARGVQPFPLVQGRFQAEKGHPQGTGLPDVCYLCLVDGFINLDFACRQEQIDGNLLQRSCVV